MSTQLASQTSLRIAYQPFLSTSRTQTLVSRLSVLPHTFLPVPSTSLQFPPSAQIILLSRGGKPFAPAQQLPSRQGYKSQRERDWKTSAAEYHQLTKRWKEISEKLPGLVEKLRQYFSEHTIQKGEFDTTFKVLTYSGEITNPSSVRALIRNYRSLRREQLEIYPLLSESQGTTKVQARRSFGFPNLRLREYVLEDHRDMLDLFRLQLEKRYKGMALVRYPDIAEPRPWILLPEDPEGAWAHEFPYHVSNLISLAHERFLMTPEEQEQSLEKQATEYIQENIHQLQRVVDEDMTNEKLMEIVKDKLRGDKQKLWREDKNQLTLPGFVGEMWSAPKTMEDRAVLEITDKQLVKRGAWRVDD